MTYERDVLEPWHPARKGPARVNRHSYEYPNGSFIVIGGLDNPDRIMSTDYDLIAVFEATEVTIDDAEKLITRLRGPASPCGYRQIVFDCNPGAPNHWLNKRAGKGLMTRLLSRHEDNPLWYARDGDKWNWTPGAVEYLGDLDKLTGSRRARLRYGKWAAAAGAVFEETWDEAVHCVDGLPVQWVGHGRNRRQVPVSVRRYIGAKDWGFRDPGVLQVWADIGERNLYRIREIYRRGMRPAWWLEQVRWVQRYYGDPVIVADHENAAEIAAWRAARIRVQECDKQRGSIAGGIHRIEDRLRPKDDPTRPRIHLCRHAVGWYDPTGQWIEGRDEQLAEAEEPTCTEEEMPLYSYPKDVEGKPIKEVPVDLYNHGIDAMRYVVMEVDGPNYSDGSQMPTVCDAPDIDEIGDLL